MDAVRDPDLIVRNNATRSLSAIAVLANRKPEPGIRIHPTRFIEEILETWDHGERESIIAKAARP